MTMAKRRSDALYWLHMQCKPKERIEKGKQIQFQVTGELQVGETETKTMCFNASEKRKLEEFEASGQQVKIINIQDNNEAKQNSFLHENH